MTVDGNWLENQMNPKRLPRGKNKPKLVSPTKDELDKLYNRVSPYMHPILRDYFKKRYSGDEPLDSIKESELLITLLTQYTNKMIIDNLEAGTVTQDIARLIGETRLALKDHNDMIRKAEELERKYGDDGRTVDPLRESPRGIFVSVVGSGTRDEEG